MKHQTGNKLSLIRELLSRKQAQIAYQECRQYCAQNPMDSDGWFLLGLTCIQQGKLAEAHKGFSNVLAISPNNAEAHVNLGITNGLQGNHGLSIDNYMQALQIHPGYGVAEKALAEAYYNSGKYAEAARSYRDLIARYQDDAHLHTKLAASLMYLGDVDDAQEQLTIAVSIDPESLLARRTQAAILLYKGRPEEAAAEFTRLLERAGDDADLYRWLAIAKPVESREDPRLSAMENFAKRGGLPVPQEISLHFALAKAYDDIKDYDQAFVRYKAANDLRRSTFNYSIEESRWIIERLMDCFDGEFFQRRAGYGVEDDRPIFIIGMPRSGTSLIEQIISCHPEVVAAGELYDLRDVIFSPAYGMSEGQFTKLIAACTESTIREMADDYLLRVTRFGVAGSFTTDKMPENYYFLGVIHLMFPRARIIHCRRGPVDTCLSIYRQNFAGPTPILYAHDLKELGGYYQLYHRLMQHWHRVLPPGRILDVCYEQLVAAPEREVRRLLSHCQLSWHEACLTPHRSSHLVRTASMNQVRRPIYRDSMKVWQRYTSHLEPLLTALGELRDLECVADQV